MYELEFPIPSHMSNLPSMYNVHTKNLSFISMAKPMVL